jgi:uncharacterized phage-like protein YoqJ
MGKMSSLFVEIETLLAEGVEVEVIAGRLGVPVSWVRECYRMMVERSEL